jgi:DNA-binding CsgD family transcriptional regulator
MQEEKSKLKQTEMQVLEIRSSNISQRKLAIIYGVKHPTN